LKILIFPNAASQFRRQRDGESWNGGAVPPWEVKAIMAQIAAGQGAEQPLTSDQDRALLEQ